MNIAVVGGGISGLSTAYYLLQSGMDAHVTLFESQHRLGGVIRTVRDAEYMVEYAADNFLRGPTAPWAEQLCDDLGFRDQLIPTATENRGAHVVWRGQLVPVPQGFQLMAPSRLRPILTSRLLSLRGKLRLCCEPFVREPTPAPADECLADFATRRLGREGFERLVQPLVSGIYTADPERLSAPAAVPQMVEMVQQYGSLYRAMRHRQRQARQADATRGARYGLFVAPRDGMQQFVDFLVAQLDSVRMRCGVDVATVQRNSQDRWQLTSRCEEISADAYDAVVLAVPAHRAATMIAGSDPALSHELASIEYAGSAVVALGLRRDQVRRPLNAFGSVVPRNEGRQILAISYSSVKFPGRAPTDRVLLRVFLGGALQPELLELDDSELQRIVRGELDQLLGVSGSPEICRVIRWPQSMPQYNLGHVGRVQRIRDRIAQHPGLYLAGNGYEGVGIPQCVKSGKNAAADIVSLLGQAVAE